MGLETYFIRKHFGSVRQEWKRFGSLFMILGIIISVATLTIAFTIFDGYERVLKETILSTNSHLYIFNNSRDHLSGEDIASLERFFGGKQEVSAYQATVVTQAMASSVKAGTSKVKSCQIRSIDWASEHTAVRYREYVQTGSWRLEQPEDVVIGIQLAQNLGIQEGDEINLVSPAQNRMTLMGIKSASRKFRVKGLYHSGIYESDSRVIFMREESAWEFSSQPGRYLRMEVKLKPDYIDSADYLGYIWLNELELDYQILSWQDFNESLFSLLKLEKWVLFFILSFLIVVASFNVVSSVSTQIIDHRRDIGILKTYGVSNGVLRRIFLGRILGTGLISVLSGIGIGMLLSWLASVQGFFKLKGDVYFLDKINVYFSPLAMLLILVTAMLIIYLAAALPLRKLNKLEITGILRG